MLDELGGYWDGDGYGAAVDEAAREAVAEYLEEHLEDAVREAVRAQLADIADEAARRVEARMLSGR